MRGTVDALRRRKSYTVAAAECREAIFMLFSIDGDTGKRIEGWVMPDNPAATPRITVRLNAERHVILEASVFRPLLKQQGLHNTGICGFILEERNCPGIAEAKALEIYDSDHNLLIYRRSVADRQVEKKFLRLETQLLRLSGLDDLVEPHFHMTYRSLDLVPEETITSIFAITYSESIATSGRIFFRQWEPQLRDRGFKIGILLRDPFEELAERLLFLQWTTSPQGEHVTKSLNPMIQRAAEFFRDVPLADQAALEGALARLQDDIRSVIFNPLTYQLCARNAFDPPPMPATAAALETLAELDAVGLRSEAGAFLRTLEAVLELEQPLPDLTLPTAKSVSKLADLLRQIDPARALVDMDLEIYKAAAAAFATTKAQSQDAA